MFTNLPTELQRKIITSLPSIELINMTSVCISIRKLNLSSLLLPYAYEGLFSIVDADYSSLEVRCKERDSLYASCKIAYERWANLFGVSIWRIFIQDLIHTIDMMMDPSDYKFNSVARYYRNSKKYKVPIFYTSQKRNPSHVFKHALNLDKQQQLSFYALVY